MVGGNVPSYTENDIENQFPESVLAVTGHGAGQLRVFDQATVRGFWTRQEQDEHACAWNEITSSTTGTPLFSAKINKGFLIKMIKPSQFISDSN